MIGLPIIFAIVMAGAFIALLVMAIAKPAPAEVEEKPPQAWPGPDYGPWGKRR